MKKMLLVVFLFCTTIFLVGASPIPQKKAFAPDFKLKSLDQAEVTLSSFRDKKPVVLFFWTTWCPYCLKELKKLNAMTETLGEEGITVIPINVGESPDKAARLVKNYNLTFAVFPDVDSKVADRYNVMGVPSFYAIDKKGYIRSMENIFPHEEAKRLAAEQ